jgi:hypothetical protein
MCSVERFDDWEEGCGIKCQKYVSESSIAANTHSSGCAQSRCRARLASFGPPVDSSYRMGVGGSDGS